MSAGRMLACPEHRAEAKRRQKRAREGRRQQRQARWPDCTDCGAKNPGRYKRCQECRNGERECVQDGCTTTTGPGLSRCPEHVSASELYTAYMQGWQRANPLQCQFWDRRREARKLGREFTITLQDVRDVYPRNHRCPVCRVRMEHGTAVPATSPSIDRTDNALGYVRGNVHVICLSCDGRKRDLSLAELATRDDDLGTWARSHSERRFPWT